MYAVLYAVQYNCTPLHDLQLQSAVPGISLLVANYQQPNKFRHLMVTLKNINLKIPL